MGMNVGGNAGNGRGRGYRPMAEINVTPFVDVMMVLLVVFMVAAPLLTVGVPIDLPDSDAKAISDEDNKPIEVTLDKNNPDARIYIKADAALDYGVVMKTLGAINGAGFRKVALISNSATSTP